MIDEAHIKKVDSEYKCDEWGKHTRYFYKKESVESLGLEYKEGRGIKLIVNNRMKNAKTVQKMAIIQTYYANLGLAPRVYNLGFIGEYPYLEVEHIEGKFKTPTKKLKKLIKKVAKDSGFIKPYLDTDMRKNYIIKDDKVFYIDFHGFKLSLKKFEKWVLKEIEDKTHWGHLNDDNERFSYQTGKRDMRYRIKQMKLDEIDFKDKRVLDVGCNLGLFMHYVSSEGGSGIGFDTPEIMNLAWLYKFWISPLAKIEFSESEGEFDIQLYLAMVHTFGYPQPIAPLTIFEGHNLQDKDKTEQSLKGNGFSKIEFINYTEDRGKRPVFWCWR